MPGSDANMGASTACSDPTLSGSSPGTQRRVTSSNPFSATEMPGSSSQFPCVHPQTGPAIYHDTDKLILTHFSKGARWLHIRYRGPRHLRVQQGITHHPCCGPESVGLHAAQHAAVRCLGLQLCLGLVPYLRERRGRKGD